MEALAVLIGTQIGFVVRSDMGYQPHVGTPVGDHSGHGDSFIRILSKTTPAQSMERALRAFEPIALEKIFTVPVPIPGAGGHWLKEMLLLQEKADNRPKKRIDVDVFDAHEIVGIDLDGTLIGHKHSARLQRYILDHPEKSFHIVTFRSHGMQHKVADDLAESVITTGVPITLDAFRGVHNIDDSKFEDHVSRKNTPGYYEWKAVKCAEVGCTIIIDDLADWISTDCLSKNIQVISPDDFDLAE